MSSTRMAVMDLYDLQPDPCDNRLIRMSNCCKLLFIRINGISLRVVLCLCSANSLVCMSYPCHF